MRVIPETDWKKLRSLKTHALNEACSRILESAGEIVENRKGREHEAYLELWDLMQKQDELIAAMFDDVKRSTAFFKLAAWRRHALVSETELLLFSEETQAVVKAMNENAP